MNKLLLIISIFFCSTVAADNFKLGVGFGGSNINADIDNNIVEDGNQQAATLVWQFGYRADNQLTLDASVLYTADLIFGLADHFDFSANSLLVGYRFGDDDLYFEPKLGVAAWELTSTQGALFNPGPEASDSESGNDVTAQLAIGKEFNERFGMDGSWTYFDHDFGTVSTVMISFHFNF